MKSYKIHLIRHGLAEGNEEGRFLGITDAPLSIKGKKEIEYLKANREYPKASVVYSSPLKRATETAEILYPDRLLVSVESLKEYNFGVFDGKTAEELKDNEAFLSWAEGKMKDTPPLGESNTDFTKRCISAINEIVLDMQRRKVYSAAAITHSGVILRLMCLFDIEKKTPQEYFCKNGKGFTIMITPELWQRDGIFEVMNRIPDSEENQSYGFFDID